MNPNTTETPLAADATDRPESARPEQLHSSNGTNGDEKAGARMTLAGLAAQLRCPHGADGLRVGQMMNLRNLTMIQGGLQQLALADDEHLLELGCGDGGLLAWILSQARGVRYTGLELSATMQEEALRFNAPFVRAGLADYLLYDGRRLPFADAAFDKALSVNTVYFWEDPASLLAELCRVLKPGGRLCLSFSEKAFMSTLPFTAWGFRLFDLAELEGLAAGLPLRVLARHRQQDLAVSKEGTLLERPFVHLLLQKAGP